MPKGQAIDGRHTQNKGPSLSWAPYSENALPIRLLPNTKIVK
jgi:hypothetical protein